VASTYSHHTSGKSILADRKFLQNDCKLLPDYTALHVRSYYCLKSKSFSISQKKNLEISSDISKEKFGNFL
jgi:hypothetical protein